MKMHLHISSVLFLLVAVSGAAAQNVFEFDMKDALKDLDKLANKQQQNNLPNFNNIMTNILRKHPALVQTSGESSVKSGGKLRAFSWKDCGTASSLVNIQSLSIGPFPLAFPGPLKVATQFIIKQTLSSPLLTKVVMEKKILGKYRKIPCVANIGSCTYNDLCSILGEIGSSCPPQIKDIGIDCTCPLKRNSYKLQPTEFDINADVFPAGDYHIIANVTAGGQPAVCLEVSLVIE